MIIGRAIATALGVAAASLAISACAPEAPSDQDFEVAEATITDLQNALASGRVTSTQLVDLYFARVNAYDDAGPSLNTMIRLDPTAHEQARVLDEERAAGTVRGPMHGIPVVLKDNYDVAWMPTTGASLALAGLSPPDHAFQVEALLEAGAIILGKTNLHELAAGITTISSLGGQTRNPYDPSRNPGGSSGGTGAAVAASLAAVGWGTDTCGSIRIPASVHNLFGLRPTKGLSSIDGILPLSHSQDTGGPLARTATDLAIALDATVGRDSADPATAILDGVSPPRFRDALDTEALDGARIGVIAEWMADSGPSASVTETLRDALDEMAGLGAAVVDVTIPGLDSLLQGASLIHLEFKFDLMDYLAGIPDAPVRSLGEIVETGLHQEALDRTFRLRDQVTDPESPERVETLRRREALRAAVLDFMDRERLDALDYPTMRQETALIGAAPFGSTCFLSAYTGLPALAIPAGFTPGELPVGLELLGRPLDDARLVAFGFAHETAHPKRRAPLRTPPLLHGRPPAPMIVEALDIADLDSADSTASDGDSPANIREDIGPRTAVAVDATVATAIAVDLPTATLAYRLDVEIESPDELYGVVLRRMESADDAESGNDEEHGDEADPDDPPPDSTADGISSGRATVVLTLGGPGETRVEGSTVLTTRLLHDLVAGRLQLLVHTQQGSLVKFLSLVTSL